MPSGAKPTLFAALNLELYKREHRAALGDALADFALLATLRERNGAVLSALGDRVLTYRSLGALLDTNERRAERFLDRLLRCAPAPRRTKGATRAPRPASSPYVRVEALEGIGFHLWIAEPWATALYRHGGVRSAWLKSTAPNDPGDSTRPRTPRRITPGPPADSRQTGRAITGAPNAHAQGHPTYMHGGLSPEVVAAQSPEPAPRSNQTILKAKQEEPTTTSLEASTHYGGALEAAGRLVVVESLPAAPIPNPEPQAENYNPEPVANSADTILATLELEASHDPEPVVPALKLTAGQKDWIANRNAPWQFLEALKTALIGLPEIGPVLLDAGTINYSGRFSDRLRENADALVTVAIRTACEAHGLDPDEMLAVRDRRRAETERERIPALEAHEAWCARRDDREARAQVVREAERAARHALEDQERERREAITAAAELERSLASLAPDVRVSLEGARRGSGGAPRELVNRLTADAVREHLAGKIQNPGGWLVSAIRNELARDAAARDAIAAERRAQREKQPPGRLSDPRIAELVGALAGAKGTR